MPKHTRREFLESGAVAAAVGVGLTGRSGLTLQRNQVTDQIRPDLVDRKSVV